MIRQLGRILNEYEYCIGYKQSADKDYKYLYPSFRWWYADPIISEINNRTYVFVEAYDKLVRKGSIAVSYFDDNGDLVRPVVVINESFHMSFPAIFKWKSDYYMIPECNDSGELRIYKMGASVYEWSLVSHINTSDRQYTDTVPFIEDDELFFITGQKDPENPLKCRTVVMRVRELMPQLLIEELCHNDDYSYDDRNGGLILSKDKKLYRVIQHSDANTYGKYVTLSKFAGVKSLRSDGEITIRKDILTESIQLSKMCIPYGMHTYSEMEGKCIIDIGVTRISLDGLLYKFLRVLRKVIKCC